MSNSGPTRPPNSYTTSRDTTHLIPDSPDESNVW